MTNDMTNSNSNNNPPLTITADQLYKFQVGYQQAALELLPYGYSIPDDQIFVVNAKIVIDANYEVVAVSMETPIVLVPGATATIWRPS